MALRVKELAPLFAAWTALVNLTCTSAIGIRFIAVSSVIAESFIMRTILPADRPDSSVSSLALIEAESSILLLTFWAVRKRFASSASSRLFPTRVGNISVMIVMVIVVNWCAIVVLFSVGKRLL